MSTANEVKPEDAKPVSEKKKNYCEVCKVPCMSSISLQSHYRGAKHRKKEKALRPKTVYLKRGLTKDITCLKDFMRDPKREEPLVGLEHVVEIRFEGRKEPHYECKLCGFNTEMAPMIEHLSGYKHRRAYISKEFPDKMKRKTTDVKECKVSFLRRIAGEIEKTEGLKMYKIEGYIRPSTSPPSKKKARWEDDYKHVNDPVQKQKALEFLVLSNGIVDTLSDRSQSNLAACGAVTSAAVAKLDSQVKLDDTRAQLLLLEWRSFVSSVDFSSGIVSLALSFIL
nr:PREDICTED: uncharacterized protein LOC106496950 [Apteryx mantelli mantelli]